MLRQRKKINYIEQVEKCEKYEKCDEKTNDKLIANDEKTNEQNNIYDDELFQKYNKLSFDTLIISCAGVNIIKILGMLQKFYEDKKIDDIMYYSGCSAGAITTLMLIINFSPKDVLNYLLKIDYKTLFHNISLQTILSGKCILSNDVLIKHIDDIVLYKLGFIPTMVELFELTKKKWTVATFNYTDYKMEYIDYKTHPQILCTHVAAASSCIPILFSPVIINNKNYIDGGVFDTFPIKNHLKHYEHSNILGIIIGDSFNSDDHRQSRETPNTIQLLLDVLYIRKRYKEIKFMELNKKENILIFTQYVYPGSGVNFTMDQTDKLRGFLESYNKMKRTLTKI
jgi:predicted patatin/cPLA2 family phospholipase